MSRLAAGVVLVCFSRVSLVGIGQTGRATCQRDLFFGVNLRERESLISKSVCVFAVSGEICK